MGEGPSERFRRRLVRRVGFSVPNGGYFFRTRTLSGRKQKLVQKARCLGLAVVVLELQEAFGGGRVCTKCAKNLGHAAFATRVCSLFIYRANSFSRKRLWARQTSETKDRGRTASPARTSPARAWRPCVSLGSLNAVHGI